MGISIQNHQFRGHYASFTIFDGKYDIGYYILYIVYTEGVKINHAVKTLFLN
jgi:hypothetical protein